ncbi:unnamed protein product [Prorocentrum cordatum]|uniref:Uncharacterized protein n=1 Tax=Prorocentrum cordatum TaxID=2364126 RepID=A0ABN9TT96_9DINO|nr:unnamed protein product [Polarella glacialis]
MAHPEPNDAGDPPPRRCVGRFTLEPWELPPVSDDWLFAGLADPGERPRRAAAPPRRLRRPLGLSAQVQAAVPAGGLPPGLRTGASTHASSTTGSGPGLSDVSSVASECGSEASVAEGSECGSEASVAEVSECGSEASGREASSRVGL